MILAFFSSCWEDKSFRVGEADIYIDIERLGFERFRVYIYREEEERGGDYVDIDYGMSEMPALRLCIPKYENNRIYLIDTRHAVKGIDSSELDFVILSPEGAKNGEMITLAELDRLNRTLARIDSVMDSIPSVTIQLNSGLNDLSVWKNSRYKSRRIVNPVSMME